MGAASFQDHREGLAQPTELFLLGEPHRGQQRRQGGGSVAWWASWASPAAPPLILLGWRACEASTCVGRRAYSVPPPHPSPQFSGSLKG